MPPAAAEPDSKSTVREYFEALLIAIIFVNFARVFVFQAFKIPTGSMEDNLKVGDHIIVNKFIYGPGADSPLASLVPLRDIERGDVVVFRYPLQPDTDFVKRVIGLPGETVSIRDRKVFIDERPLDEPYVLHDDPQFYFGGQFSSFRVPEGQYFVMGDNRDHSHDSRYWGGVPRTMIKGRAFMVYWSFEGEPPPPGSSIRDRVRELVGVVVHFFDRTRWHRTFFIVDSRYHYTPGVSTHGIE